MLSTGSSGPGTASSERPGTTGGAAESPAPAERRAWILLAVALVVSLFFLVHPWYDAVRDGSIYITTTRSLLAGEGYTYLGEPFILRPPGFPVLLAPVIAIFGADVPVLNSYVALYGALAVFLFARWLRGHLALPLALAAAAALWLNPGFRRLSNEILSDVPGLAALFACLLVERWAARAPSPRREIVVGVAIALSTYVRSMVLLLTPAIMLSRIAAGGFYGARPWRMERQRLALAACLPVVVAAVLLPWSLRNRSVAPSDAVDQVALYDYSTGMWHRDGGNPDSDRLTLRDILQRAPVRARQIVSSLGGRMRDGIPLPVPGPLPLGRRRIALACVLLAALGTALVRRRRSAEIFAVACLGVVLFYFDYRARLVLPVFAIAIGSTIELAGDVARRLAPSPLAVWGPATLIAALALLDFEPRRGWSQIEAGHRSLLAREDAIRRAVEPGLRLGTGFGHHDMALLDRPVYSVALASRRTGSPETVETTIDRYRLDRLVLTESNPVEKQILNFLRPRYPATRQIADGLWLIPVRAPGEAEPPNEIRGSSRFPDSR